MTHISGAVRRLWGALVLSVLPFAAACSGVPTASPTSSGAVPAAVSTSVTSVPATSTTTAPVAAAAGYCDALRTGQTQLEAISGTLSDPAAAKQGLVVLSRIEAAAPAEVKPAWGDFIAMIKAVSAKDTNALVATADKAAAAMTTIEKHAKAECGITLS